MKARTRMIIVIFVVATFLSMVSLAYADTPNEMQPANSMWVEPSTVDDLVQGDKFNVTIWVNLNTTCGAWQFKMIYNKAHLNITGVGYTAGSKSDFLSNLTVLIPVEPIFGSYNATHDYALHGESALMAPFRNPGYGSLSWIEFEVMADPPAGEVWTDILDIKTSVTTDDTKILTAEDSSLVKITFSAYDGTAIIPEFSSLVILAIFLCFTLVAVLAATNLRKPKLCTVEANS